MRKSGVFLFVAVLAILFECHVFMVYGKQRSEEGGVVACNGSMAECYGGDEMEFLMDSEVSRRILQQRQRYISYASLGADKPAAGNGQSGKPYDRGCQKVYGCRS